MANIVSNKGNASTINGATITIAVYVFAIPKMEIIDKQYPKKLDPVSPINVLAGLKLYGKNPTNEPHNAVIRIMEIIGDPFKENIIKSETQEIIEIPKYGPGAAKCLDYSSE